MAAGSDIFLVRAPDGKLVGAIATAEAILRGGGASVGEHGVDDLRITNVGDRLSALLADPSVRQMRALALSGLDDTSIARLGKLGNVARLEELDLAENSIGDAGLTALVGARLEHLEKLRLHNCQVRTDGAVALASASLPMLHDLDLGNSSGLLGHPHFNMIGSAGCVAFARSGWLPTLDVLLLNANGIETEGAEALAAVSLAARDVDLSYNSIELAGVAAIAGRWPNLERIGLLHGNRLTADELIDVHDPIDGAVIDQERRPLTGAEIESRFGFRNVY